MGRKILQDSGAFEQISELNEGDNDYLGEEYSRKRGQQIHRLGGESILYVLKKKRRNEGVEEGERNGR